MTDAEPVRKRPVQREHELQKAIRQFVRDAIDVPPERYQFFAFDSAQKATDNQRARMIARGVVPGCPDTMLCVLSKNPVWVELKTRTGTASPDQLRLIDKLNTGLGHRAAIARTVMNYWAILSQAGIPMRANAELIAVDLDLKVASRITKAEQRATSPGNTKVRAAPRYTLGKTAYKRARARGLV